MPANYYSSRYTHAVANIVHSTQCQREIYSSPESSPSPLQVIIASYLPVIKGVVRYVVVKTVNNDMIKHKMKWTASLHVCMCYLEESNQSANQP